MENNISLRDFLIDDYNFIFKEINDLKAVMQWAGPKYTYPLTWEQMNNQIQERDEEGKNVNWLFTVIENSDKSVIGHGQIKIRDRINKIASIGSVLILKKYRGLGYSTKLMSRLISYGFDILAMNELSLGVFDFNLPAIKCYKKLRFKEFSFKPNAREVAGEKWNLIKMRKTKQEYEEEQEERPPMT
jgi:RimJ/RimL family protein N-acetyltransferase